MTADHPMVRNSIELLLAGEAGNSAFGVWEAAGPKSIILEAYFLVECIAPAALQTDHYLPSVPIRVAVDYQEKDLTANLSLMKAVLRRGSHRKILDQPKVTGEMIPAMLKALEALASQRRVKTIKKAVKQMETSLHAEKARLLDLSQVNPMIDDSDLEALDDHREALRDVLTNARLRLDSLRLIYKVPTP